MTFLNSSVKKTDPYHLSYMEGYVGKIQQYKFSALNSAHGPGILGVQLHSMARLQWLNFVDQRHL